MNKENMMTLARNIAKVSGFIEAVKQLAEGGIKIEPEYLDKSIDKQLKVLEECQEIILKEIKNG